MSRSLVRNLVYSLPDFISLRVRSIVKSQRKRLKFTKEAFRVAQEFSTENRLKVRFIAFQQYLFPKKRILFYPKTPSKYQVYYKASLLLGYTFVEDPADRHDLAVHFQPSTFADSSVLSVLSNIPIVINRNCKDVSKVNVQRVFKRVFGYDLEVDPTKFNGEMVEKSNENYRHDGRILKGPIDPSALQPDCVYQRAINTQNEEGYFVDLRTPIYNGKVPLVYAKVRTRENRFGSLNEYSKILNPVEIFSNEELSLIAQLAEEIGVDYAEMDILRDKNNGQIYVVDVNNTPAGPAKGLSEEDRIKAMRILSKEFESLIESALQESLRAQKLNC